MGHSYKGSRISPVAATPVPPPDYPAATLNFIDPSGLKWAYTATEPDLWATYLASNITLGSEIDVYAAGDREEDTAAAPGDSVVIVGLNATLTMMLTPASNAVVIT